MASDDTGDWGQPNFLALGAPEVDVDPNDVSDYFASITARRFATYANLISAGAPPSDGYMARVDSIPGAFFLRQSGAWVMHGVARFDDAGDRSAAITAPVVGMRSVLTSDEIMYQYIGSAWAVIPALAYVARRSASQSIPNITETLVDWDAVDYTTGAFTESAGVLTCVTAGTYWVTATATYDNNSANGRYLLARRTASGGGSSVSLQEASLGAVSSTYESTVPVAFSAAFTAGQELRLYAFHNQGAALNLNGAALRIERIA
jgi:hypothetical protein